MSVIHSEDQAKAIIRSAVGIEPGKHPEELDVLGLAEQHGKTVIEAAEFLRNLK
ncbi:MULTISPECIES: hypothetical protein [Mycolicibacterium]|uniref:hypothetical protein n=1 Tax=Mycolicibacterium TaxID=1866885 RepID=UPI001CDBF456|nr:hypothetical protein [Mycolicibacterium fortuitum]UBV20324.1 hypothetical protein H8Z59_24075 [Mycolicibacterium fortuitum]